MVFPGSASSATPSGPTSCASTTRRAAAGVGLERSSCGGEVVPARPQLDEHRCDPDDRDDERELENRAPPHVRAQEPAEPEGREQEPRLDEKRLPVGGRPELRERRQLEPGAQRAGDAEQDDAGGREQRRAATLPSDDDDAEQHADPRRRREHVADVERDVDRGQAWIERVAGHGRHDGEPEREEQRRPQRDDRSDGDEPGEDEPGRHGSAVAHVQADAVRLERGSRRGGDRSEAEHDRDPPVGLPEDDERVERDPDGDEHAREEEPARERRPCAGPVASASRAAVGGARPSPTANASTPDSRCPSSETIDQRTE